MSPITTHVLDTSRGKPAAGMDIVLERVRGGVVSEELGRGITDEDGRLRTLLAGDARLEPGDYSLRFDTGKYFAALGVDAFYPHVAITFRIQRAGEHYHVPLLLNPFGYSTYRGS